MRFIAACTLAVLMAAPPLQADAPGKDAGAARAAGGWRAGETLSYNGTRLAAPLVTREELRSQRTGPASTGASAARSRRNIAAAMAFSAVLPGMGELYVATGSKKLTHYARVPLFIALDAWFWYGYRDNHDKGKEVKAAYERFGDEHWSEERFLLQHPYCDGIGGCDSWEQYNEEARGDYYYFVYIPRALDHEEYYENMGKYDAFCFGWDDWNGDYDDVEAWTPNRTYYWSLRTESDDYLLRADRYVMALIINRVVSMLDAGWLAYRYNRGVYDDKGLTLEFRPGTERSTVGISYRF
jgi:hypothetical protein